MQVQVGNWFEPIMHLEGLLKGIISNPPYIPSEDLAMLQVSFFAQRAALTL